MAGCASENSRYKDNASLERPPEVPVDKQAVEQQAVNEVEAPIRRHGKGLKSDVYRVEGSPLSFKIKRTFDETWSLLNQAIQHNELDIKDQDRSKGTYYIAYGGGGLFSLSSLFPKNSIEQPTYMVRVELEDPETKVTVSLAGAHEQSDTAKLKDESDNATEDKSEQLLDLLYDTLHDTVKEE
ncbi:hypothetical protein MCAMS1_02123 [biofilm metagenome]